MYNYTIANGPVKLQAQLVKKAYYVMSVKPGVPSPASRVLSWTKNGGAFPAWEACKALTGWGP
eukprot:12591283-Alexandrium_andersonii.AAC.1